MHSKLFPNTLNAAVNSAQGEMLSLIDRFDWSSTSVGPLSSWPQALLVTTRLMLATPIPMVMLMGPDGIMIYNDAYSAFAGKRHPFLLGAKVLEGWSEVADFNRHVLDVGLAGQTLAFKSQRLTLHRNNVPEEVWMDLDYSPVLGDDARPLAVLAIVYDVSKRVLAEQALTRSEESLGFALNISGMVGIWDWDVVANIVTSDAPFAKMFGVDPVRAAAGAPIEEFVEGVYPDDRVTLRDAIDDALRNRGEFRAEYRLRNPDGEIRWVLALGRAVQGSDGKSARLPGIVVDITERKAAEAALAESEGKFRAIADSMPQMVWSALPDGFHDYFNARWYEFTGAPVGSTDGEGWSGMFHPDDRERARATWRHSLATGDPYEIEYRLRHRAGQYRWTLGRALPVRDEAGRIVRWMGTLTDIHEAKIAAEEREIIAQELSHRIKNIFSVLNGIIGLSARSRPEHREFADELRGRIRALSQAHDFVRPHSQASRPRDTPATVAALIGALLRPYDHDGGEARFAFTGDDAAIDDAAATPLSLLLHELGTNASKYGALSRPDGRVEIAGQLDGDRYRLMWREGGTPAATPTREGFGSRLITLSVEGQLGGALRRTWSEDGLTVEVDIPVASLTRTAKARQTA